MAHPETGQSVLMGWTQPHYLKRPLKGQDGKLDHPNRGREEGPVMKVTTIGIDLAKDVFGLHGVDGQGRVAFKKRLVRSRLLEFMSQLPRCLVGLEACSSAHYWARKIERLGHRVRLMSPRFVKPYRKSDKNDANDAEAICEAVTRASMRFVPIKSEAQHEVQALHRVREQLLKSRAAQSGAGPARGARHRRATRNCTGAPVAVGDSRRSGASWPEWAISRNLARNGQAAALLRR